MEASFPCQLPRAQRSTFILDLTAAGWAALFLSCPAIPGELDVPCW